jgi:hypothetical protein
MQHETCQSVQSGDRLERAVWRNGHVGQLTQSVAADAAAVRAIVDD